MVVDADVTTWIGSINLQGNLVQIGNYTITGVATFNGIPFSTHKHIGVTVGGGTSGTPTA
jgi:phage baseplate assembly protein gpV